MVGLLDGRKLSAVARLCASRISSVSLVVVMSMGRIEQIGKPSDIRARPKTQFVREFLAV